MFVDPPPPPPIYKHLHWIALKLLEIPWTHSYFLTQYDFWGWLFWVYGRGFVTIWGDEIHVNPTCVLIARPMSLAQIKASVPDKAHTSVFTLDPEGDSIWIDFLWSSWGYSHIRECLVRSGKTFVGWQHRKTFRMHIKRIPTIGSSMWRSPTSPS